MKATIDKAGRVVIPAPIRARAGFEPGTELEVTVDDLSVRLLRAVPGPRLESRGARRVARPTVAASDLPDIDFAELVRQERDRWP
jgi:AbrB family looped-hinge helix DNA binding protein